MVGTATLVLAVVGAVLVGTSACLAWASSPLNPRPGYAMDVSAGGHPSFTIDPSFAGRVNGAGPGPAGDVTAVLASTGGVRAVDAAWPTTPLLAGIAAGLLAGVAAAAGLAVGERTPVLVVIAGAGGLAIALLVDAVVAVLGVSTVPQADLDITLGLGVGGYLGLLGAALAALGGTVALLAATRGARR